MIGKELEAAIGDAPEHIAGLRKLAVAFAIGGRLDEPSTAAPDDLLTQIEATKKELERAGQLKRRKGRLTVQPEHLPEAFNDVSRFVPLAEIASIEKGKTGIKQAVPGKFPLVVTAAARETCDHFDFDAAAAIIPLVSSTGHGNASINRLHYQEGKFALGTILAAVIPHDPRAISARFLFEYLSAFKDELLVSRMTGTANVTLTIGRIGEVPVPLLSAEAQTKVDELMALCDRLEEARKTREELRDKLTAASLARLTSPDTTAEEFPTHAAFALEALPALTMRPDQIKTLHQTILNLAVRGKLVEQDAADEPASALLEREFALPNGHERRRKIIKEAAIDASKGILTTLPATWKYVRIQDLYDAKILIDYADGNHGSLYPRKAEFGEEGVNFVSAKDLIDGRVNWAVCSKLNRTRADQLTKGWAQTGDVLLTHNATVGRVARVPEQTEPFLLGTSVTFYRLNKEGISPDYFYLVLRSPIWQGQLEAIMAQTTRNQVSIQKQAFFQVPVPPLAEQHRIVAKVDALMALCDRLEAALTTTYTTRTRLLEALLHEALEPAATALEAAE